MRHYSNLMHCEYQYYNMKVAVGELCCFSPPVLRMGSPTGCCSRKSLYAPFPAIHSTSEQSAHSTSNRLGSGEHLACFEQTHNGAGAFRGTRAFFFPPGIRCFVFDSSPLPAAGPHTTSSASALSWADVIIYRPHTKLLESDALPSPFPPLSWPSRTE